MTKSITNPVRLQMEISALKQSENALRQKNAAALVGNAQKNDTSADKRKAGVFTSARGSGIGVAVLPTTGGEENDEEEQNAETDAHQKSHASEENVIALSGIRRIVFAGFGGSV